jgi:hypothetical protein
VREAPVQDQLPGPRLDSLFTAVFALVGWAIGMGRLSDNSFFWHLRAGQLILDRGFPHRDPFSFTAPGARWVLQSWLAELGYAGIDRLAGPLGIRVLVGVAGMVIGVLSFRLALRLARDRVRAALLATVALLGVGGLWSERPLVFAAIALVVLLWVVEVPDSVVGRRPLVALPILLWCWANVHGSFALGFAYLGLHLLGRWLDGHPPRAGRERQLLAGTALAAGACFINPYGVGLVTFPLALLARSDMLRRVVEWQSPDFHSALGVAFAIWIAVFAALLARAPGRSSRRDLLVSLPFLVLGLWAVRNVAAAALVGLPIAARAVARQRRREPAERTGALGGALAAVLIVVAAIFTVQAAEQPSFAFDGYSVRAFRALQRHGLLGKRVLTSDVDAGYVILRLWPRQHVYMDDRYDMYPRSVQDDYFTLAHGGPGWAAVLKRRDIQVIVWPRRGPLVSLVESTGRWRVLEQDRNRVLLVRADVAGAAP